MLPADSFRIIDLLIGKSVVVAGIFTGIIWGEETYYIKLEMDIGVGTDYLKKGLLNNRKTKLSIDSLSVTQKYNTSIIKEPHPIIIASGDMVDCIKGIDSNCKRLLFAVQKASIILLMR